MWPGEGEPRASQDSWSELLQGGTVCAREEPGRGRGRQKNEEGSL